MLSMVLILKVVIKIERKIAVICRKGVFWHSYGRVRLQQQQNSVHTGKRIVFWCWSHLACPGSLTIVVDYPKSPDRQIIAFYFGEVTLFFPN